MIPARKQESRWLGEENFQIGVWIWFRFGKSGRKGAAVSVLASFTRAESLPVAAK